MPKRYWYVIFVYIIMQFSSFPVALFVASFTGDMETYMQYMTYWSIFSFIAALVIILWMLKPDMQLEPHREATSTGGIILWSILGVILAFFAQGLAASIEIYILGIEPGSENTFQIMEVVRSNALFILIPAIIAPILEEIIFRKIVFGSIYKRTNFLIAALLSALIFAAVHWDFSHLLMYTAMGFVFAFLYVRTKRILVPIIVHAGMNTMVVLAQYSLTPEEIEKMREQLENMQMIFLSFL